MADSDFVNILDAGDDLLEETACFVFLQALALDDVVEELTAVCVLHDEEELSRRFNNLVKLYHVGVPNDLQNVDLASDSLYVGLVFNLVFLQDLDRYLLARDQVSAEPDLSKSALSERSTYFIIKRGCTYQLNNVRSCG